MIPDLSLNEFLVKNIEHAILLSNNKFKARDIKAITGIDDHTMRRYKTLLEEKKKIELKSEGRPPKFSPEYAQFITSFFEDSKNTSFNASDVRRALSQNFQLDEEFISLFTMHL